MYDICSTQGAGISGPQTGCHTTSQKREKTVSDIMQRPEDRERVTNTNYRLCCCLLAFGLFVTFFSFFFFFFNFACALLFPSICWIAGEIIVQMQMYGFPFRGSYVFFTHGCFRCHFYSLWYDIPSLPERYIFKCHHLFPNVLLYLGERGDCCALVRAEQNRQVSRNHCVGITLVKPPPPLCHFRSCTGFLGIPWPTKIKK